MYISHVKGHTGNDAPALIHLVLPPSSTTGFQVDLVQYHSHQAYVHL